MNNNISIKCSTSNRVKEIVLKTSWPLAYNLFILFNKYNSIKFIHINILWYTSTYSLKNSNNNDDNNNICIYIYIYRSNDNM